MTLPSPTTTVSPVALTRATCDGEGLITFPTADGPEHFACQGCRHCTPGAMPVTIETPHARLVKLLRALRAANSREELSALWAANQDIWTNWLTRVGMYRLRSLDEA